LKPNETEMILGIPEKVGGYVVGKGGTKIKSLQARTKARIGIVHRSDIAPFFDAKGEKVTHISVRGAGDAVETAYNEIEADLAKISITLGIVAMNIG
jgi:hypothetical protein